MSAKNHLPFSEAVGVNMVRNRGTEDKLDMYGRFPVVEHWRDGKLLETYKFPNAITNVGKDYLFNAGFNTGTVITQSSWCIGLVDNTSFTAFATSDTMASHGGWIEFTGYSQSTRVAWGQTTSTAQTVTNGTPATFDITASGNLQGIFVTSGSAKSGTTGTLWTEGSFPSVVPVVNGDQIKVTYALSA